MDGTDPAVTGGQQPGPPPGWHADPTLRHEVRWWDGTAWTAAVADQGVQGDDPLGAGDHRAAVGLDAVALAFVFDAPGVPPWRVLDGDGVAVGWVHPPHGLGIGPRPLTLVDHANRPVLSVKGSIGASGYEVSRPDGARLGLVRLTGVGGMRSLRLELHARGQLLGRLDSSLTELVQDAGQVVDPAGTPLAELTLRRDEQGRRWFGLRRHRLALPPVVNALPLALHADLSDRTTFSQTFQDVDRLAASGPGHPAWPGL